MICVLVLAGAAAWETGVLAQIERARDLVVLRRCVDVPDLLAAAGTGQAQAAVVDLMAPGFDAAAVEHLRAHGVQPVAVTLDPTADAALARAARTGVGVLVGSEDLDRVADLLRELPHEDTVRAASGEGSDAAADATGPTGRHPVVAVWGPHGAPGRTTLACALAMRWARQGHRTVLVDADPWAASVAQQLGLLEEQSGLLAATRALRAVHPGTPLPPSEKVPAAASVPLDPVVASARRVGTHLDVLTGLPRPERHTEVRPDALAAVLAGASRLGRVVVDTGAPLEESGSQRVGRNAMTLETLLVCDQVLVVGTPDPVGLTRLVHGLTRLADLGHSDKVRVVINRMRPGVGWSQAEVRDTVADFAGDRPVHFLPEDRPGADQALMAGRTVVESSRSGLAVAAATLADHVAGPDAVEPRSTGTGARRGRGTSPRPPTTSRLGAGWSSGLRRRTGSTDRQR